MGSATSRGVQSPPSLRPPLNRRNPFRLFPSMLCGGSSSREYLEMEDHPAQRLGNSQVVNRIHTAFTSSSSVNRVPSDSHDRACENTLVEASNGGQTFSENKELVVSGQVSVDHHRDCHESHDHRDGSTRVSISFKEHQSLQDGSSCPKFIHPTSSSEGHGGVLDEVRGPNSTGGSYSGSSNVASAQNQVGLVSSTDSFVTVVDIPVDSHPEGEESVVERIPLGLGNEVPTTEQVLEDGRALFVRGNREARRNNRRLLWDAVSRRSSRRRIGSSILFSPDDNSENVRLSDRWLLDISNDFTDDGAVDGSTSLGSRSYSFYETRRHSQSELRGRIHADIDENSLQTTYCPSGLHAEGSCSCDASLMNEEPSTRASISRIVMLAEALFEVLDEIHRQPASLPLSMTSLPAPESVVDSFPLKNHKKTVQGDVEQCYICLAEYEQEDRIRVLPCLHEYHMLCIDKWLKEIHGVCPLCRGNVCQGVDECSSISNSEGTTTASL